MTNHHHHPAPEQISAFLAEDLTGRQTTAMREHLADCGACAQVADELRHQVDAVASLGRFEPPVTMWAAIEGTLDGGMPGPIAGLLEGSWRRWRGRQSSRPGGGAWSWRSLLVGAAAGAALVSGARFVGRGVSHRGTGAGLAVHARPGDAPENLQADVLSDLLLAEAENELGRAASAYAQAAARLRGILEREQIRWAPAQRARIAERLASLDEAVAHSRAVVRRDPADGAGAEMLFAAYQKQIDFLAEAVHRGSPSVEEH